MSEINSMATFARRRGSRDKKRRKTKYGEGLNPVSWAGIGALNGVAAGMYIGNKLSNTRIKHPITKAIAGSSAVLGTAGYLSAKNFNKNLV
jgi:hypothetical protein